MHSYKVKVAFMPSLAASIGKTLTVNIPAINRQGKAAEAETRAQMLFVDETGKPVHTSQPYVSTPDSLFFYHDLDHLSAGLDFSNNRWDGKLAEHLITCFHIACNRCFDSVRQRYPAARLAKANEYTTEEDPTAWETYGHFGQYRQQTVDDYTHALQTNLDTAKLVLETNARLQQLSKHYFMKDTKTAYFELAYTPAQLNKLAAVHNTVLKQLKQHIRRDKNLTSAVVPGSYDELNSPKRVVPFGTPARWPVIISKTLRAWGNQIITSCRASQA